MKKLYSRLHPAHVCANCPTLMEQAIYMGEGLAKPKLYRVKGFNKLWDSKTPYEEEAERPSERSRPRYISLVTDTESEYKKVFSKLNPARIGANRPTQTEGGNQHRTSPGTAKI